MCVEIKLITFCIIFGHFCRNLCYLLYISFFGLILRLKIIFMSMCVCVGWHPFDMWKRYYMTRLLHTFFQSLDNKTHAVFFLLFFVPMSYNVKDLVLGSSSSYFLYFIDMIVINMLQRREQRLTWKVSFKSNPYTVKLMSYKM